MTWVGWFTIVICLLAFGGNFVQWRGYRTIEAESKWVKRALMGGLALAFLLNVILLFGILFVGTGPLF